MSPATHFLVSWVLANVAPLGRRERALVVCAGVAPDLDGLGIVPQLLTRNSAHPLLWFSDYHHHLHTLAFALLVAGVSSLLARRRCMTMTALLALASFHLHLLCDLLGARGPDGYPWPIPYLLPFSGAVQWMWHEQWALNGWQNFAITGSLLALTLWQACKLGRSPVELVSPSADRAVVAALRRRFPAERMSAAGL
jgi:inner membrane protein